MSRHHRRSSLLLALASLCSTLWGQSAWATPPAPVNVNLNTIADLGTVPFGPGIDNTSFSSLAVSASGNVAYFGRTYSFDPQMRNLVVATLSSTGTVLGIPQCYVASTFPLAPLSTFPTSDSIYTRVDAMLLNSAKNKLYLGEDRSGALPGGLSVFSLDSTGYPTGSVATYANGFPSGDISAMAMHPTLPILYSVSDDNSQISAWSLDSNGNPTGANTLTYDLITGFIKTAVGVSANGKHLYLGSYPDLLEVFDLDSTGALTNTETSYTVSNPQVGTVTDFLYFKMGKNAIYMVRPSLTGSGSPFLAIWPLNASTGQPIGNAQARYDITPPCIAGELAGVSPGNGSPITLGIDTSNALLWVANSLTHTDPFTSASFQYGVVPTCYTINANGTLAATGTATTNTQIWAANGGVAVPSTGTGAALYFNNIGTIGAGNFVSGYQYRITVTTNGTTPTSQFPATGGISGSAGTFTDFTWGGNTTAPLGQPSDWINVDGLLENSYIQSRVTVYGPTGLTKFSVRVDLANSAGTILKSVTEQTYGNTAGFLLPGYEMPLTALTTNAVTTNSVTGLETFTQRSKDLLDAANVDPVASANKPVQFVADCFNIVDYDSGLTGLDHLLQAVSAAGFNTSYTQISANYDLYGDAGGLTTNQISTAMSTYAMADRQNSSYLPTDEYPTDSDGSYFNFDTAHGMTTTNLAAWANWEVDGLQNRANGGTAAQTVTFHMTDEPGWYYPAIVNEIMDTVDYPTYLPFFQNYLQTQPGLTLSMFGKSSWSQVLPVMQSVGNPNINPGATTTNRVTFYWTMKFFADSANAGNGMGATALRAATTNPALPVGVNYSSGNMDTWYSPQPYAGAEDYATATMDWFTAGRTNAYTLGTEDWFDDNQSNYWSLYAAAMRSACMLGGTGTNFEAYTIGEKVGAMTSGAKYKIFSVVGNGGKGYAAYDFGPEWTPAPDTWSGNSPTLYPWVINNTYSCFADANRLLGQSESILYPAAPEHSKVAVLLPGLSHLWDTNSTQLMYYQAEFSGLHMAISHGYNMSVDYLDDIDVGNGILTTNDYYALYVLGPNVSHAAQTKIHNWVTTYGTHNRQLILEPGAGTANEYDTATTNFDSLAGVTVGSRTAFRANVNVPSNYYEDPYTATIQDTNASDSYFYNTQTMNIAGPFEVLSPASGFGANFWVDQAYTSTTPANQPAAITKKTTSGGISNYVTTYGFYPGYQYQASVDTSYVNQLPQGWSVMARESAIMPVVRLVLTTTNPLVPTVQLSGTKGPTGLTLGTTNNYLTTTPVEALRLNVGSATAPTSLGVVLLNWGGTPVTNLKFQINSGISSPTTFKLASGGTLSSKSSSTTTDSATMSLTDVDVVMISQ